MKAIWNGAIIADSNETVMVENNHYFPDSSLNRAYVAPSSLTSLCPWKGTANYYSLNVNGKINENAAWYYPEPKPAAKAITNRVAFWKGVQIVA